MTDKQFTQFKREFRSWQERWGLLAYDVSFERRPLANTWGEVSADPENFVAVVTLSSNGRWTSKDIKATACHESLHLLFNQYNHLAHSRYIRECELCGEEERIVRSLEKELIGK